VKARLQFQASPCAISGGKSELRQVFLRVFRISPVSIIPPVCHPQLHVAEGQTGVAGELFYEKSAFLWGSKTIGKKKKSTVTLSLVFKDLKFFVQKFFPETYKEMKPITVSHYKCKCSLLWNQSFGIWKHIREGNTNEDITFIHCVYMNANDLSQMR